MQTRRLIPRPASLATPWGGEISAGSCRIYRSRLQRSTGSAMRRPRSRSQERGHMRSQRHLRTRRGLRLLAFCGAAAAALVTASSSLAVVSHGQDGGSDDFDSRTATVAPSDGQLAAVASLGAEASWTSFGTPRSLIRHGGYLATGIAAADAESAVRAWLDQNAGALQARIRRRARARPGRAARRPVRPCSCASGSAASSPPRRPAHRGRAGSSQAGWNDRVRLLVARGERDRHERGRAAAARRRSPRRPTRSAKTSPPATSRRPEPPRAGRSSRSTASREHAARAAGRVRNAHGQASGRRSTPS